MQTICNVCGLSRTRAVNEEKEHAPVGVPNRSMLFFLMGLQGHAYGATCCAGHVTFLLQGRAPPSLIHGRPPPLLAGVRHFLFPHMNPEGFHLRFRGHGGIFQCFVCRFAAPQLCLGFADSPSLGCRFWAIDLHLVYQ